MNVRYSKYLPASIYFTDFFLLNFALIVPVIFQSTTRIFDESIKLLFIISNITWLSLSYFSNNYTVNRPLILTENLNKFFLTLAYHLIFLLGALFFMQLNVSRYIISLHLILFFILILTHRVILFFVLDYIRKKGYNHRTILTIGEKGIADRFRISLGAHPEYGYDFSGFISKEEIEKYNDSEITKLIESKNVDEIYLCYKEINTDIINRLVTLCELNSIKVKVISDLVLESSYARLINFGNLPVLSLSTFNSGNLRVRCLKRGFDLLFSTTVMASGIPVFMILVIMTKLTSKGPVFYRQERIGRNGKPFNIYKFRSMYTDAEKHGPQLAKEDDPRVTPWGKIIRKTRLDELPQFYNVFKGEMSVVGPRPERQHFIEQIIERAPSYKKLLAVKPGITSIGQVRYGYAEDVQQMVERMRYDLIYRPRLRTDMSIIIKTIMIMAQAKGQ